MMADVIYRVQAPDGSILKVMGPEDATDEEIEAFASKQFSAKPPENKRDADRIAILQNEYVNTNKRVLDAEVLAVNNPTPENKAALARAERDLDSIRKELVRIGPEHVPTGLDAEPEATESQPQEATTGDEVADKRRIMADVLGTAGGAAAAKALEIGQKGAQTLGAIRDLPELLRGAPAPSGGPTSGAKWLQNWGNIAKEGFQGGVPEAAAQYNKMKPQGEIMGALAKKGLITPQPVQPGVFTGGQLSISGQPAPAPAPGPLSQTGGMLKGAAGAALRSPITMGALGGLSMAEQGQEFYSRYKDKDIPGMMISGAGVGGGALSLVPHPATRALGAGLSAASPLTMYLYDKLRMQQTTPPTPEELSQARRPAFIFPNP